MKGGILPRVMTKPFTRAGERPGRQAGQGGEKRVNVDLYQRPDHDRRQGQNGPY